MKHIKNGIFFAVLGVFAIGAGTVCGSILGSWDEGPVLFLFIMGGISFFASYLSFTSKRRKEEREKEEQERQQQMQQEALQKQQQAIRLEKERIDKINNEMKEGLWKFPSAKFYQLCRDGQATVLDNEFSIRKATNIAQQLILEKDPKIDLECCDKYLSIDGLNKFLEEGKHITAIAESEALLRQKQPKDAKAPTATERTFLTRAEELSKLSGCDKRVSMLTNMVRDYDAEIKAKREGEEALKQLGMIYAQQQKKETSWAIMGGIAEGIAGPAAGIMAATNTVASNRAIQEYNASVRKASMEIMSGIPGLAGDRYKLEKEREKLLQQINIAKDKISLAKPTAKEIWDNIKLGNATVKKNPSGVLELSVTMDLKEPFVVDVPETVYMVVDGTIRGDVYFEDKFVDYAYFPLPLRGVPINRTVDATLDGMCGRSVEYDGKYTVKFGEVQNIWIMECQSVEGYPLTDDEITKAILHGMKPGREYTMSNMLETIPGLSGLSVVKIRSRITPLIDAGKVERIEQKSGPALFKRK